MVKKTGLGKGLGALIPDDFEDSVEVQAHKLDNIDINMIKSNALQPRKVFNSDDLQALSVSIQRNGIIQPLVLRPMHKGYEIIAGERRWRAARLAGLDHVPAIIMDPEDEKRYELSLIENIQRVNLNPIEEGLAYRELIEKYSVTQNEVSDIVGKSRTYVTNMMRLLNLEQNVQDQVAEGLLSTGHARALVTLDQKIQKEIASEIISKGLSVRQVEAIIKKLANSKNLTSPGLKDKDPYIEDLERKIADLVGTKVNIHHGKQKGKIEIEYYTDSDLERILGLLEK